MNRWHHLAAFHCGPQAFLLCLSWCLELTARRISHNFLQRLSIHDSIIIGINVNLDSSYIIRALTLFPKVFNNFQSPHTVASCLYAQILLYNFNQFCISVHIYILYTSRYLWLFFGTLRNSTSYSSNMCIIGCPSAWKAYDKSSRLRRLCHAWRTLVQSPGIRKKWLKDTRPNPTRPCSQHWPEGNDILHQHV